MPFKQKKDKFFELLKDMSANLQEATTYLVETKQKDFKFDKVKEIEVKGDEFVHTLIKELNKTFITPIEREDLMALGMSVDDVLDGIEHYGALVEIYSMQTANEHMEKFIDTIAKCAKEISEAISLIAAKKLSSVHEHSKKIKEHETTADQYLRKALKELFTNEKDVIKIIQYKEIYETLEKITDDCQNVAKTLETIVMKNV
jgi:predicted phosphate transport protein (TIGR00153 family)